MIYIRSLLTSTSDSQNNALQCLLRDSRTSWQDMPRREIGCRQRESLFLGAVGSLRKCPQFSMNQLPLAHLFPGFPRHRNALLVDMKIINSAYNPVFFL